MRDAENTKPIFEMRSMVEWCEEERTEGNGPCGACALCCKELRYELDNMKELLKTAIEGLSDIAGDNAEGLWCGFCTPIAKRTLQMIQSEPKRKER